MNDEHTQDAGTDETEGHRFAAMGLPQESDGEGTEGHRQQIRPEDSDTEGHLRVLSATSDDDDDTEGHGFRAL